MADNAITADGAEAYLTQRLAPATVRVHELAKFPRGVSRETWLIRASVTAAGVEREQGFSLRRDLPGGAVQPYPLREEYEVYRRLEGSAIPAARALWYESAPGEPIAGPDFYVRERIEGDWEVPHFSDPDPRYDELRIGASKEHLRKLALVHTCDWRALGFDEIFDPPPSTEACATHAVDRLARTLARYQIEPLPAVTEALEWLREQAPRNAPRISLLKGTNGHGEEIFRDGEIVGLSDWEEASLGDPAFDFAHTQEFLPGEPGWVDGSFGTRAALDYYENVSGIHVELASLAYYRILRSLEVVLFSHHAALPLVAGTDLMARLGWVATEMLYVGQTGLARAAGILDED